MFSCSKNQFIVWISFLKIDPKSEAFQIYWGVEQKCRNLVRKMSAWVLINHTMTFLSLIVSLYFILIGDFDTSKWILPLDLVVPFNTESLFGWYLLWFYNLQINIAYSVCLSLTVSHFICGCMYLIGMCDHLSLLAQLIREEANTRDHQIRQTFGEVVKAHVNLFEWVIWKIWNFVEEEKWTFCTVHFRIFDRLAEINSGVIISLLPCNAIILAISMFNIEYVRIPTLLLNVSVSLLFWQFFFSLILFS